MMPTASIVVHDKEFEPFISAEQIEQEVDRMAAVLNEKYLNQNPIVMPVLTGAYYFASLLFERLTFKYALDFVKVTSYGNRMHSSGDPILMLKHQLELNKRSIIIIEDVIETGLTTDFLYEHLQTYQPSSVEMICLLFKPGKFEGKILPHMIGFEVGDEFVVGAGMDYAEDGRYLKDIYRLKS